MNKIQLYCTNQHVQIHIVLYLKKNAYIIITKTTVLNFLLIIGQLNEILISSRPYNIPKASSKFLRPIYMVQTKLSE